MTSTTFIDKTTLIEAPWLNDVDALVYQGQLDDGTTGASISRYLPAGTGAVATTVQDVLRREIWVEDFGAVGDGTTDDTVSIQAAIDWAISQSGITVRFQAKTYKITAPLVVGESVGTASSSVVLQGSGDAPLAGVDSATLIYLYGTGHTCIIEFRHTAYRDCGIRNIALATVTEPLNDVYAAEYGIFFSDTSFNGHNFYSVTILNVRIPIYVKFALSANGEFMTFDGVTATRCQVFFKMGIGTGQSFGHMFRNCGCGVQDITQQSPYYAMFEIGDTTGGYGLYARDCSSTFQVVRTSFIPRVPSYYVKQNGSVTNILIEGGRIEGLSSIIQKVGSGNSRFSNIDFAGIYITPDFPIIDSGLGSTNVSSGSVTIQDCAIPLFDTATLHIKCGNLDTTNYLFERCFIGAYYSDKNIKFDINPGGEPYGGVEFRECLYRPYGGGDVLKFNKKYGGYSNEIIPAYVNTLTDGIPHNLIINSNFGGATPLAPWVTVSPFNTWGVFFNGNAVAIQTSATTEIYQDIYTVTASREIITYLACFNIPANYFVPNVKITLSNPTTGEVYDSVQFGSLETELVKLVATTSSALGKVRLTITSPAVRNIVLYWQTASKGITASFVPTSSSARLFTSHWGSIGSLRAFERLAIPYVNRTAVSLESLPDVESDLAISSSTKRLIYYANGRGNEIPNQDIGSAAPTTLTYPLGWIRYNSAPAPSGTIGWVCTTAGTMGTLNGGATTGSITTGTAALAVSATTGLLVGQMITIAGVSGIKTITGLVPTATTGSITTGTASLLLASVTNYVVGTAITIAGVTGTKYIISVIGNTVVLDTPADATVTGAAVDVAVANSITINSNADATVAGAAVAFSAGVWKTFGAISA